MAIDYYDWNTTSSGSSNVTFSAASVTTAWVSVGWADSSTSSTAYNWLPRRILVRLPKHWRRETVLSFVRLLNKEIDTGFTVDMVIWNDPDITITDPNVEVRTWDEFLPLLRYHAAGPDDLHKLNEWVGAVPPPEERE